ncbi:MAG: hypothetical protein U0002_08870 [Thermoanaerobaculia bacterium]
MARSKHSDFSSRTHDALHSVIAPYHEQLHQIALVEARCRLQRAVLKATNTAELSQNATKLGLSADAVSRVAALCW